MMWARQAIAIVFCPQAAKSHACSTVSLNLGSQHTPKFSVVLLRRGMSISDKKKGAYKQQMLRNFAVILSVT